MNDSAFAFVIENGNTHAPSALGAADVDFRDGELEGYGTVSNNFNLRDTGTHLLDGDWSFTQGYMTLTGAIANHPDNAGVGGTLTIGGTVYFSGTQKTYTGATTINGSLVAAAANVLSTSSETTVSGSLYLSGTAQTVNTVRLTGGELEYGTLTGAITSTGTSSISSITGSPTLDVQSGTLTLTGTNTLGAISNAGSITNNSSLTAGTLTNTGTVFNPSTWNGYSWTYHTWNGNATNNGGTINNGSIWTGAITNTSGTLTNSDFGTISAGVTNAGTLNNTGKISGGLTNSGTATLSGTVDGGITNTGAITVNGDLFAGDDTFTQSGAGSLAITSGTMNGVSAMTTAGNVTVGSGTTLTVTNGINNGVGTGAAFVIQSGATVNGATANTGTQRAITNAGALTSAGMITGGLTNSGTATLSNTVEGGITNSGAITVNGDLHTGNAVFTQSNTGSLAITSGVMSGVSIMNALGNVNVGANTQLLVADGITTGGTFTIQSNATVDGSVINTGTLTSVGMITDGLTNSGTATLSGTVEGGITNAGAITVNGDLDAGNAAFTQSATGTLSITAGEMTNVSTMDVMGNVSVGAGTLLEVANGITTGGTFAVGLGGEVDGVLTNTGTLSLADAATVGELINNGSTLVNSTDAASVVSVGPLSGTGTFGLSVALGSGTSIDLVEATTITGNHTINLTNVETTRGYFYTPLTFLTGTDNDTQVLAGTGFESYGLIDYGVRRTNAGWAVASSINPTAAGATAATLMATMNTLQYAYEGNGDTYSTGQTATLPGAIGYSFWAQIKGGRNDYDSTSISDHPDPATTRYRTTFSGVRLGADADLSNVIPANVETHVGVVVGYSDVRSKNEDVRSISTKTVVPSVGVYGAISGQGFFADLELRRDFYDTRLTNGAAGLDDEKIDVKGYGAALNVGKTIPVSGAWFVEPSLSLNYAKLDVPAVDVTGGVIDTGSIDSLLGAARLRVGTTISVSDDFIVRPSVQLSAWRDFRDDVRTGFSGSGANDVGTVTSRAGDFQQIGIVIDGKSLSNGVTSFLRADYRFGNDVDGGNITLGAKIAF